MYSELLAVIRVTTARFRSAPNTIYSTLWPWGYQNITVGPQQLPPITSPDISWLRLHTARTRARRARPDCAIVEVVSQPFQGT